MILSLKSAVFVLLLIAGVFVLGLAVPDNPVIPVKGATPGDWNPKSFWHGPWGSAGVHKGIDIFAPIGRPVLSSTWGVVLYTGRLSLGGNVIVALGPKWRLHYYAHLNRISAGAGQFLSPGETIGEVGNTGNATTTPPHLHYAVATLIPYPWRWDRSVQGWKKMFYLDSGARLAN